MLSRNRESLSGKWEMHNTSVAPLRAALDAIEAVVPEDREALIELLRKPMIEDPDSR